MDKREKTKQIILKKSRENFLNNDITNTVMNDIALSSDLSVRTLYRYFETKEDLVYEVTIELLNEWNDYQRDIFNKLEGNGIERLKMFLNNLIDYMSSKTDVMRYLGEFDFYFQDQTTATASEDSLKRFNEIILVSEDLISDIIDLGKKDKSIRENLKSDLMVATISNVLWSFGQRVAIRGKVIKEESGFDGITLIKNQVEIYISNVKEV